MTTQNWNISNIIDNYEKEVILRSAPWWNMGYMTERLRCRSLREMVIKLSDWADSETRFDWKIDKIKLHSKIVKRITVYDNQTDKFKPIDNCNDTVFSVLRGDLSFDKPEPEPEHVSVWDTGNDASPYTGWKT